MDKKSILVVDDERTILMVLENLLTSKGYLISTAGNGKDAVILATSKCPDLIILDLVMPNMDGSKIAEKLKENPKTSHIPIIFLTALLSRNEQEEMGHLAGNSVCLAKPYETEELLTEIEKLLSKKVA